MADVQSLRAQSKLIDASLGIVHVIVVDSPDINQLLRKILFTYLATAVFGWFLTFL